MAFESLKNVPKSQKIILVVMLFVAAHGILFFYIVKPKYEQVSAKKAKLENVKQELSNVMIISGRLPSYRTEAQKLKDKIALAEEILPGEKEIPDLFKNVSLVAHQSGMEVVFFQPRNLEYKEFYAEIPVGVTLEGNYHDLGNFFSRLGKIKRILELSEMKLKGSDRKNSTASTLKAEMILRTYMFLKPEAIVTKTPEKGKK